MTEPAPSPPPAERSPRLDEVLARTQAFIATNVAGTLKTPAVDFARFVAKRVVGLVVATIFLAGAGLLLMAGSVLLLAQSLPMHVACLVIGAAALVLGLLVVVLATRM